MPVATRVEKYDLVRAGVAVFEASTQGSGATGADVSEYFALSSRQSVSPASEERLSVLAEDIGHLEPMLRHTCGSGSPAESKDFKTSESEGL